MAILHLGISNNSLDYTHLSITKHHLTMTQIHNFLVFPKETYLVSETMINNKKNKLFTEDVIVICQSGSPQTKTQRETDLSITRKTIKINWMIPRVILCITKKLMRKLQIKSSLSIRIGSCLKKLISQDRALLAQFGELNAKSPPGSI